MGTEWRQIPGWPYLASSDGQIIRSEHGNRQRHGPQAPLSQYRNDGNGYQYVVMVDTRGNRGRFTVHTLILMAFVGACPDGNEARHLNGLRHDNRLSNLAWGTRVENAADRERHGNQVRGSSSLRAILTEAQVRRIWKLRKRFTQRAIACMYAVSPSSITAIKKGRSWAHVGQERGQCYK